MQKVWRPRGRRSLLTGLIAGLCAFAIPASAASAEPWPCDGAGYVTQFDGTNPAAGTSFNRADRQPDDTYQLTELGNPAGHLNAVAFRPQDGFMYGLDNTLGQIVRIERDAGGNATFTPIGLPAGSGITNAVVGAVLADGTYLIWQNEAAPTPGHGAIFDVSGPTAQLITTVTPSAAGVNLHGDFAVSPIDGELYGVNSDNPDDSGDNTTTWGVYRFTLSGGTLTREERVADAASAGAGFFQPDGKYIMYVNGTVPEPATPPEGAGLYSVDLTTGERTFLGSGPILSNVDGTGCANGLAVTKDATPRTVVQGEVVTYIHTITSRALVDSPVDFSDQLPAGMKYVPGGVTMNPSSFGTPNDYGDTRNLSISGSLAPDETVRIRARVRVSPGRACDTDVENQSQAGLVVPGLPPVTVDSDDPTTGDDPQDPTAVEIVCGNPRLKLKKETPKGTVRPGEVIPYRITVANKGTGVAAGVKVCDKLPSGLELLKARGAKSSERKACWTLKRLGAGKKKTLKVVAQVKTSTGKGSLTNRATAKGRNTKRTKAKEQVKVETVQDPCAVGRIAARC